MNTTIEDRIVTQKPQLDELMTELSASSISSLAAIRIQDATTDSANDWNKNDWNKGWNKYGRRDKRGQTQNINTNGKEN